MKFNFSISHFICISIVCILLSTCEHDKIVVPENTDPPKNSSVDIQFISPKINDVLFGGDTLFVNALAISENILHGYKLQYINMDNNDSLLKMLEDHVHNDSILVMDYWVHNLNGHNNVKVLLSITTDHDGSTERDSIVIHCMP